MEAELLIHWIKDGKTLCGLDEWLFSAVNRKSINCPECKKKFDENTGDGR